MPLKNALSLAGDVVTYAAGVLPAAQVWGAANDARYARPVGSGVVSKIGFEVAAQSGNISVAVYTSTGAGRLRAPGTRIATSGAVSCPAVGYQEVALDVPVFVTPDHFIALSCDNVVASFLGGSSGDGFLFRGQSYRSSTSHPLPATTPTLVASRFRFPFILGAA